MSPKVKNPENPRTKRLLDELRAWCDEGHGRQAEIATLLGVTRYAVGHWLNGRQFPNAEHALTIQEFLQKQRKKRNP